MSEFYNEKGVQVFGRFIFKLIVRATYSGFAGFTDDDEELLWQIASGQLTADTMSEEQINQLARLQ